MDKNGIYCIPLKRLQGEREFAEIFDSEREFYAVYDEVKKGILSTTSQINPEEFVAHFKKILEREKTGDIIHISLSSALSGSHNSCVIAAEEINKTLNWRKIYAFDSLSAAVGQMLIVDKFLELRANTEAQKAVEIVTALRETENVFFIVDDLHHLKRGGRVSATKAFIGTILGIKPVLCINKIGKLGILDKTRGGKKAVEFFMKTIAERAPEPNYDYADKPIIVIHTTQCEVERLLCDAIKTKYPRANLKRAIVGPIIGTHAGCGAVGLVFAGKNRPESH